jgi:crotonobetainyl-CoA:carnitine CoA-transferase CaiB-like acyl-CoA transferase
MPASRALHGVTVVALEQAVAAPLCTQRLAEAGARVIKVERAEGDFARGYDSVVHGESAYFAWLNRGKESVVLDIKDPADALILSRLIETADVFVQNLLPGAAARSGFGSAELRAKRPNLITCDISGYGDTGPLAAMKAYDLLIQCETGLASVTGAPSEPGRVGVSVADIGAGLNAYAAILQALFHKERSGEGASIAVSLFDGLADWMSVPLLHHDYGGRAPERVGLRHPSIAPYGVFHAGDGRRLVIAVQNEREWARFCESVLGSGALARDPRFAGNAARCALRGDLEAEIDARLQGVTGEELASRLEAAGIAFGRVNEVADLSTHSALRRREAGSPTGPVSLPAGPVRWDAESASSGPVPRLDEHGAAIRAAFSPTT